jgi:hypothetical protein
MRTLDTDASCSYIRPTGSTEVYPDGPSPPQQVILRRGSCPCKRPDNSTSVPSAGRKEVARETYRCCNHSCTRPDRGNPGCTVGVPGDSGRCRHAPHRQLLRDRHRHYRRVEFRLFRESVLHDRRRNELAPGGGSRFRPVACGNDICISRSCVLCGSV